MQPILDLKGICVERNDTRILDDVDLRILPGEHWALLGPNGSGKTTLLNVVLTYVAPTRGAVRVLGETYGSSDWRGLRKRVGIVSAFLDREIPSHERAINVVYSGSEAMLGSWGKREPERARRAMGILENLGAEHVHARAYGLLSQGERQRVLIGRAMMAEPELLILDEPCAGLDPVARESFLESVSRLMTTGAPSVLLVTHHIEEIPAQVSHAALLKRGRIIGTGPKERALTEDALSQLYGVRVGISARNGRYQLNLQRHPGG